MQIEAILSKYIEQNLKRVNICLSLLTEEQVWEAPGAECNSIGNLILHLCGNVRQYVISGIGGQEDNRQRDLEFSTTGGMKKKELEDLFKRTLREALETINKTPEAQLNIEMSLQGFKMTGLEALVHVTEHLSYHIGQITQTTKQFSGRSTGYYEGRDLNAKNAPD